MRYLTAEEYARVSEMTTDEQGIWLAQALDLEQPPREFYLESLQVDPWDPATGARFRYWI